MRLQSLRALCARTFAFGLTMAAAAGQVQAQTFPSGGWLPLTQQGVVMSDPFDGAPPFAPAIDIVGDKSDASAFVASDADYLYFRLLVASNPHKVGGRPGFVADAWMCLLDIDSEPQTYELLTALDGIAGSVDLEQNTTTVKLDGLDDPAESVLATYPLTNAEGVQATSTLGGTTDYFVDWAVGWNDLAVAGTGFAKGAPFRLVCGTSTSQTSLAGGDVLDFGTAAASFSTTASDALACGDSGCAYDAVFKDGFEGP